MWQCTIPLANFFCFSFAWLEPRQVMLRIGKHNGSTYKDVAASDRTYCSWVLSLSNPSPGLRQFARYLKNTHGGVLEVGAYRGAFFNEMLRDHPNYCIWAARLDHPSAATMRRFCAYVRREANNAHEIPDDMCSVMSDSDEDPFPKRPCPEETHEAVPPTRNEECKVCMASTIRTCFVPCGHMAACIPCAARLVDARCPICRASIREVVETFAV